ncbi:hypothetical protein LGZ99_23155 [Photorhabdus temperata]|uniref:Uncharacterized protein n=2 Tax=Photorhabdus TaxID=29487 RepID=A0A7X5TK70_9GAMM|nr:MULTISPECIES: hypothetical protein [Photorhabdus]KER01540.1 hypothetical protein MEG1DRAFT_03831 [Photorhabdus temperata subsp. temperata Meg1]MCT8350017.1 hypothetical protein [Photorhabdus temperata]NHB94652.1 hypothetical protein [Photorhabdus cinerea]
MKYLKSFAALVLSIPMMAFSASPIVCENESPGNTITSIWPSIYLSDPNTLCFDVKGWPEFSGTNCVKNGKNAKWTGLVIVWEDGEPQGRDSTHFRVVNPVVTDEQIQYRIEWSRGGEWRTMQNVAINRLTGDAVSYFVNEHGGESYQCRVAKKAI